MELHFLHIGKTGGTALSRILKSKAREIESTPFSIMRYKHDSYMKLIRIETDTGKFVFFVRHPVSRFVSGFYSRQRKGRPAYFIPWSKSEEAAFGYFKDPESLAVALDSDDPAARAAAIMAMEAIQHVSDPMTFWVGKTNALRRNRDEIFFIGAQETFDADCAALLTKIGVNPEVPTLSESERHASGRQPPALSERATKNIEAWYAHDLELYQWCMRNRETINNPETMEMGKLHTTPKTANTAKKVARRKKINALARKAAKEAGLDWATLGKEERKPFKVAARTSVRGARKRRKNKKLEAA